MKRLTVATVTTLMFLLISSTLDASDKQKPVTDAYSAAFRDPGNQKALEALKQVLPKVQDYYVIEGDILVTDQELQEYVDWKHGAKSHEDKSAELLVNLVNGQTDYYKDATARTLTYSVLKPSFPTQQTYDETVKNIGDATAEWESVCPDCQIHFVYKKEFDANASPEKTNFVVRYFNSGGRFIAASFFPHDGPLRRYLNVDPTYFSSSGFDRVGVFRHELGHVLGYRHEHIRGIAGCGQEGTDWLPLTTYDPHSVMHYFCGGGGSPALRITAVDVTGHKKLYGGTPGAAELQPPPPPPTDGLSTLVVRFEGGDVTYEAAKVLMYLAQRNVLPLKTYSLKSGENPASIYVRQINLPGSNEELYELIGKVNRDSHGRRRDPQKFQVGDDLEYPDVTLTTYEFAKTFDRRNSREQAQIRNITKNWDYLIKSGPEPVCPLGDSQKCTTATSTKVRLKGYELRLDVPASQLPGIVEHINALQHANVLVTYRSPDQQQKQEMYSRVDAREYLRNYRRQESVSFDTEAYLGDLVGLPSQYQCEQGATALHPDIILIDEPVYHHPDLDGGVANLFGPDIPDPVDRAHELVRTAHADFARERDHGTHLAGILIARKNGFGVAGLDPAGHVESWNWIDLVSKIDELADDLYKASETKKVPFFVFASKWPKDQAKVLGARVDDARRLWVTAAGQDDQSLLGEDIDEKSDAPMRYGLKDYVVVVTACAKCMSLSPQLVPGVNYSTHGLVHVAAPGDLIPSTISGGSYDAATGTSQATAMVAGLTSAMISCWPTYYTPERVKFRLQLTSKPALQGTDFDKVAAGIVDGRAAILDPTKDWFYTDSTSGELTGKYSSLPSLNWCTDTLTLVDDNDEESDPVSVKTIRRIVQVDNKWIIYSRPAAKKGVQHAGEIRRIGPGVLKGEKSNLSLLHTSIGDYTLAQIKDVLLARQVGLSACSK